MFEPTPHYLVVESLADQFRRLLLADPIEKALWEGKLLWGDILCTPEEEERERVYREQREAEETAERAATATAVRPTFFGGFSKPIAALERDVPAFPAGRLTLMAKNLPRDIDVKELRIIFEQYGAIRDIYIPKNMDKSSPYYLTIKGFALIKFLKPDDSARAFAAQYALVNIRGKNIALEPASADR
jgi:FUS-interacting serine-arginine-rich protein 1